VETNDINGQMDGHDMLTDAICKCFAKSPKTKELKMCKETVVIQPDLKHPSSNQHSSYLPFSSHSRYSNNLSGVCDNVIFDEIDLTGFRIWFYTYLKFTSHLSASL